MLYIALLVQLKIHTQLCAFKTSESHATFYVILQHTASLGGPNNITFLLRYSAFCVHQTFMS